MTLFSLLPLALLSTPAQAEEAAAGVYDVDYGDEGLWNDADHGEGLMYDGREVSYEGREWTVMSVTSDENGDSTAISTESSDFDLLAFDSFSGMDDTAAYFGPTVGTVGVFYTDSLMIVKRESWDDTENVLRMDYSVTNTSCEGLHNVALMHAVDPDQDLDSDSTYDTINDTVPSGRVAFSQGPFSDVTVAYGLCDGDAQEVGHTNWNSSASSAVFTDEDEAQRDITMHIRQDVGDLAAGETATFSFLFVAADSDSDAVDYYWSALFGGVCPAACDEDMSDLKTAYMRDYKAVSSKSSTTAERTSAASDGPNANQQISTTTTTTTSSETEKSR